MDQVNELANSPPPKETAPPAEGAEWTSETNPGASKHKDDGKTTGSGFKLWPHQRDGVDGIFRSWDRDQYDRTLLVQPTGSGKTVTLSEVARRRLAAGRVLVLAHTDELIQQARDKMYRARRLESDLEKAESRTSLESPLVVSSVQTLSRPSRLERFGSNHFLTIIVDEAHRALAPSYGRIIDYFANAKLLGVTATPDRGDKKSLGALFQDIAHEVSLVELIRTGYLAPITVQTVPIKIDISKVAVRAGDFSEEELDQALDPVLEQVARGIAEYARDRKTLVFTPLIRTADRFAQILRAAGFAAEFVSGKCVDRAEKLQRFARGETRILANAQLLTEGYDEPSIDCVVILRPTRSRPAFCLDEQTEILTPDGWKLDVEVGQQVAAFDPATETIQFVPAKTKVRRELYPGEYFLSLCGQSCDLRVTNNHRLLYRHKRPNAWRIATAQNVAALKDGVQIPVSGYGKFKGVPLSDDEIRFIGWVMTDGTISKSTNAIAISQSESQPWFDEIERVLQSCGLKYGKYKITARSNFTPTAERCVFSVSPRTRDKHLRGYAHLAPWISKTFADALMELDEHQFGVLLEAMHLGNGNKHKPKDWTPRSYHISSGHKLLLERIQIAAIQRGYRASLSQTAPKTWIIHLKKQSFVKVGSTFGPHAKWKRDDFNPSERCWCVENELGTRRNGKVAIVGNCQMAGRGFRIHPGKGDLLLLDFLWHISRHSLIRPASLIAKDEKEAEQIERRLGAAGGDLIEALRLANHDRDKALAAAIRDNEKRGARRIDIIELELGLHAAGIADYEPTMPWHFERASDRQLAYIARTGIDPKQVRCKGEASAIIELLEKRRRLGLATFKQARLLRRLGHPKPHELSIGEAGAWIKRRLGQRHSIELKGQNGEHRRRQ